MNDRSEFQEWFGKSKMIGEDGSALMMYHITANDFDQFIPGGNNVELSGPAIWLSPDKYNQPAAHNTINQDGFVEGTRVIPVFVKMERPLYLMCEDEMRWAEHHYNLNPGFPRSVTSDVVDELRAEGYDGIYVTYFNYKSGYDLESGRGIEVIVFDGNQVINALSPIAMTRLQAKPDARGDYSTQVASTAKHGEHSHVAAERATRALAAIDTMTKDARHKTMSAPRT